MGTYSCVRESVRGVRYDGAVWELIMRYDGAAELARPARWLPRVRQLRSREGGVR